MFVVQFEDRGDMDWSFVWFAFCVCLLQVLLSCYHLHVLNRLRKNGGRRTVSTAAAAAAAARAAIPSKLKKMTGSRGVGGGR